jgi:hypothetical protein
MLHSKLPVSLLLLLLEKGGLGGDLLVDSPNPLAICQIKSQFQIVDLLG